MPLFSGLKSLFSNGTPGGISSLYGPAQVPVARFRTPRERLDAYSASVWVYICVSTIAQSLAAVAWKARDAKGEALPDTHPLNILLAQPAPGIDGYAFIEMVQSYIELSGNAIILKDQMNKFGQPKALYPLNPVFIHPIIAGGMITGYKQDLGNGQITTFDAEEIIHVHPFNPWNPFWGMSTIEAGAATLDGDMNRRDFDRAFYKNGAKLSGILSAKATLNDAQRKNIKAQWDTGYSGVRNMHKTAVLDGDMSYQPMGIAQSDMMMLDSMKWDRDELLALFGVPGVMVGLSEYANYKSDQVTRNFWDGTIAPRSTRLDNAFHDLALAFGAASVAHDLPDTRSMLDRANVADVLAGTGALMIDEIREMIELPPLPNGEGQTLLKPPAPMALPGQQPPADTNAQSKQQPPADANTDEAQTKRWSGWQSKALDTDPRAPIQADAQRHIQSFLSGQAQRAADRAAKSDGTPLTPYNLLPLSEDGELSQVMLGLYDAAGQLAFARAKNDTGAEDLSYDVSNPRIADTLNDLANRVSGINSTTRDQLRDVLAFGLGQGMSMSQLAAAIQQALTEDAAWRSQTIARTETQYAYNQSSLAAYADAGVTHAMLLDGDGDSTCQGRNGKVVTLSEAANVSANTHPNCLLAVSPVINPPAKALG